MVVIEITDKGCMHVTESDGREKNYEEKCFYKERERKILRTRAKTAQPAQQQQMTLILEEELHLANRIRDMLPSPFPPLFCGWSLSIYLNGDAQAPTVGVFQDQRFATLTLT